MRTLRLAALTIFALPLPVIAALVSVHCHGAGPTETSESFEALDPALSGGQAITSFIVSPAAIPGG